MLIDRRQLEELVRHKNEENQVVSVYLNLTPPRSYASELNSMTHTTLHSLADRLEADRHFCRPGRFLAGVFLAGGASQPDSGGA